MVMLMISAPKPVSPAVGFINLNHLAGVFFPEVTNSAAATPMWGTLLGRPQIYVT
jgi:hypothetical protein